MNLINRKLNEPVSADDVLLEKVKEFIKQKKEIYASTLQEKFGIGYARAARLLNQLEEKGIVSAGEGGKPRNVLWK